MQFAKHLRDPVKQGKITTSIRVWIKPRVKVGGKYRLEAGYIVVDGLRQLDWGEISPAMAKKSGFNSVDDLLKTAKHGSGENVYLIDFHYIEDDDYADEFENEKPDKKSDKRRDKKRDKKQT